MKIEIRLQQKPIDIFGIHDPEELFNHKREVYLDGNRMPPALEDIFLLGLDTATEQYIDMIHELRKEMGDIR